jgi:D-proline reductase (dithiol) PrdB
VGLIARVLEEEGISTVCTTFRKDIIELARPPRILSLKFSPGKPLGNPGDIETQKGIIEAGFDILQRDIRDMTIIDLPFRLNRLF